jgi:predicted exporter
VGDPEKLLLDESTPVFLGCLTTVGAFCSLLLTDSDLLRDFGLFASVALIGSTLFALIFLPHFLPKRHADSSGVVFRHITRLNSLPYDRRKWFLGLMVAIIIVGCIFSPNVTFDSDLRNLDFNSEDELASEALFNAKNNDGFAHQYYATVSTDFDEAILANQSLMVILDSLKQAGIVHSYTDLIPKLFITQEEQEHRILLGTPSGQRSASKKPWLWWRPTPSNSASIPVCLLISNGSSIPSMNPLRCWRVALFLRTCWATSLNAMPTDNTWCSLTWHCCLRIRILLRWP